MKRILLIAALAILALAGCSKRRAHMPEEPGAIPMLDQSVLLIQ